MKKAIFLLHIYLLLTFNPANAAQPITLAVHPYLSEEELIKMFTPLANYLREQTGIDINVKIGSSYDEHIDFIGRDQVDIAYMGPASYVTMTERYGKKRVLVRQEVDGEPYFQGNIIVRDDSGITSLSDLKGKRIVFGDPNSTMGFLVPHYMLHKAGVFDGGVEKHQFLHSHNNVALAVLTGEYDAGAVKPAVYEKFKKDGLRIVASTPRISEHLFVANNRLGADKVQAIRTTLLGAKNNKQGLAALHAIKESITAFIPAEDEDYANLRQMIKESRALR